MKIRCSSALSSLALGFTILAGCTPARVPSRDPDSQLKGRRIVERAVQAHGGLERWNHFQRLTVRYREQWSWPFTWFRTTPWPANHVHGTLTLWLHQARAEMLFDDRPDFAWRWSGGRIEGSGAGSMPKL